MSIRLMNAVWEHANLPPTLKLVLLGLADQAGDRDGIAWPSMATIARRSCISQRQAIRVVAQLVEQGYLEVAEEAEARRSRRYRVPLLGPSAEGCQIVSPLSRGVAGVAPGVSPMSPEPEENHQRSVEQEAIPLELPALSPQPSSGSSAPAPAREPATREAVEAVFAAWLVECGKNANAKLTPERDRVIRSRLREGYAVSDLQMACRGWKLSPHHRGETNGTIYNELALLLKNGANVEKFRDLVLNGAAGGLVPGSAAWYRARGEQLKKEEQS